MGFQVVNRRFEYLRVISSHTKHYIAMMAEDGAGLPGVMVVVDVALGLGDGAEGSEADGTRPGLVAEDFVEMGRTSKLVSGFEDSGFHEAAAWRNWAISEALSAGIRRRC